MVPLWKKKMKVLNSVKKILIRFYYDVQKLLQLSQKDVGQRLIIVTGSLVRAMQMSNTMPGTEKVPNKMLTE